MELKGKPLPRAPKKRRKKGQSDTSERKSPGVASKTSYRESPTPRKRERVILCVLPDTKTGLDNETYPGSKVPEQVYQDATFQDDHPTQGVIPVLRKGDYLATLDLKDAYLHIPICKGSLWTKHTTNSRCWPLE